MKPSMIAIISLSLGAALGFALSERLNIEQGRAAPQQASAPFGTSANSPRLNPATQRPLFAGDRHSPTAGEAPSSLAAGHIVAALAEGSRRQKLFALEQALSTMSVADAPFILAEIQSLPNHSEKSDAIDVFFETLAALDGPAAYDLAGELRGREQGLARRAAMRGWAKQDVHAAWEVALDMVNNTANGLWRHFEVLEVFNEMAIQAPDTYLDFLNQQANNRRHVYSMVRNYMDAAMETGQQKQYWERLQQSTHHGKRRDIVEHFFREWGNSDVEQPLQAIAQIDDPREADKAMMGFLNGWAASQPQDALDYAFQNLENPSVEKVFKEMLANAFHQGSAQENSELVSRLQTSELAPETFRDAVRVVSRASPHLAIEMASSIDNEQVRMELEQHAVQSLATTDLNAAILHYQQTDTAEHKVRLFNSINWQLVDRSDGGERLDDILRDIPEGKARSDAIQSAVVRASYRSERMSPEYKDTLVRLANSEINLSEEAKNALQRISASD